MNMVRTGVVKHPSEWKFCGYHEILNPPMRYTLIDYDSLISCCGYSDKQQFQSDYKSLIDNTLLNDDLKRKSYWTETIAIGDEDFIDKINILFGGLARGRKIKSDEEKYMIQEEQGSYNVVFDTQKYELSAENR